MADINQQIALALMNKLAHDLRETCRGICQKAEIPWAIVKEMVDNVFSESTGFVS